MHVCVHVCRCCGHHCAFNFLLAYLSVWDVHTTWQHPHIRFDSACMYVPFALSLHAGSWLSVVTSMAMWPALGSFDLGAMWLADIEDDQGLLAGVLVWPDRVVNQVWDPVTALWVNHSNSTVMIIAAINSPVVIDSPVVINHSHSTVVIDLLNITYSEDDLLAMIE